MWTFPKKQFVYKLRKWLLFRKTNSIRVEEVQCSTQRLSVNIKFIFADRTRNLHQIIDNSSTSSQSNEIIMLSQDLYIFSP